MAMHACMRCGVKIFQKHMRELSDTHAVRVCQF